MRGNPRGLRTACTTIAGALGVAAVFASSGCADTMVPAPGAGEFPDASASDFPPFDDAAETSDASLPITPPTCVGFCPPIGNSGPNCPPGSPLSCYVNNNCPGGAQTTITGTVFDPAGRNPLPNVVVYVPEDPNTVPNIVPGTSSCVACTTIRDFVTIELTDAQGHFTLRGAPTGKNVPLILQVGKWRRTISVPNVVDCGTTELPNSGSGQARLPRNRMEGDMPGMAILTGGCDNVACFLRSVGVDASEFSAPRVGGRVDVYQGLGATGPAAALSTGVAGDCTTSACPLWSSKAALEGYDTVFLGCECDEHAETKPASSVQAMHDWLGEGGEVFATHSQTTWFKNGPSDLQSIADWTSGPPSGAPGPFAVDSSFMAGQSLETWLAGVGGTDANGDVPLDPADVSTSVATVASPTRAWIRDSAVHDGGVVNDGGAPTGNAKLLTAPMPVAAPDAGMSVHCGKVDVSDIHPGGGQALQGANSDGSSAPAAVPAVCDGGPLSPGDEALEFLLFYQPTCVQFRTGGPPPPPPNGG
jgi:hypothetical protein